MPLTKFLMNVVLPDPNKPHTTVVFIRSAFSPNSNSSHNRQSDGAKIKESLLRESPTGSWRLKPRIQELLRFFASSQEIVLLALEYCNDDAIVLDRPCHNDRDMPF
jgi:hypothetical protein